eukprot:NODE_2270_length_808_cov_163.840580_g1586_i0.p1 GENE.NODE_2270_length_808_cov_163.840580_g1586_i0~~NODE_2270_length_808_cov_163.840580_g1586_i0.p1  ORF type:complete len:139 (-),score=20.21 NODE_2270_length_808_cov_163.840580_g1586_i0:362-778(-)
MGLMTSFVLLLLTSVLHIQADIDSSAEHDDVDFDNLHRMRPKVLRRFLSRRGVDDSKLQGGEKRDLIDLVLKSKDLPVIEQSNAKPQKAKPTGKAGADKVKDDIQDILRKLREETGMNAKMYTADDLKDGKFDGGEEL